MAKSAVSKKAAVKSPAAFAKKTKNTNSASDNPSKYQPAKDAAMDMQSTGLKDGLSKLFADSVKDLYWAENHLVKALPKMAKSVSSKSLAQAIVNHLEQTKTHVERLEQVFESLGKKPQAKKCDAMEGLVMEGEGVIEDTDAGTPARDLGIIMAAQKVEHYEIAAYTGLIKLAGILGLSDAAETLTQTLAEEQQSDQILSGIADNEINPAVNEA